MSFGNSSRSIENSSHYRTAENSAHYRTNENSSHYRTPQNPAHYRTHENSSHYRNHENSSYYRSGENSTGYGSFADHLRRWTPPRRLEDHERDPLEHSMLKAQVDDFFKIGNGSLEILPGALCEYLATEIENEASDASFRSGIPDSEKDFWSDNELCPDNEMENYIPPLTKTKTEFVRNLARQQINDNDSSDRIQLKRYLRYNVILAYLSKINKEQIVKAYRRLKFAASEELPTVELEAEVLKQMELYDKKLNRGYYYEETEPYYYKQLLKKRIDAVKRKFVLYVCDPCFRNKYVERVTNNLFNVLQHNNDKSPLEDTPQAELAELDGTFDLTDDEYETAHGTFDLTDDGPESEAANGTFDLTYDGPQAEPQQLDGTFDVPGDSDSNCSSIYDFQIPLSEVEYFSSPPSEEMKLPKLIPKSRRQDKLRRYEKRFAVTDFDNEIEKNEKMINLAEVRAHFRNYCQRQKADKAVCRHKAIGECGFMLPSEEAQMFTELEMVDKKLHRNYYWWIDEPEINKLILAKRRRAIVRKYEKYANDRNFRTEFIGEIYTEFLRTRDKTIFDSDEENQSDDDESSFNDSDIPTSEDEFMDEIDFKIPWFTKPVTRTKELLYEGLQKYEVNGKLDSPSEIFEKMQNRLALIQLYKNDLADRRKRKALHRLNIASKLCCNDPVSMSQMMEKQEIQDKKLDRGFYYTPDEPEEIKYIHESRLEAIRYKYKTFREDCEFRTAYESRIRNAMPRPPKEIVFESDSFKEVPWVDSNRHRDLTKGDSLKDDSFENNASKKDPKEVTWETFETVYTHPSFYADWSLNPHRNKKQRKRELKMDGIIKPLYDTAPAILHHNPSMWEQSSVTNYDPTEFRLARIGYVQGMRN